MGLSKFTRILSNRQRGAGPLLSGLILGLCKSLYSLVSHAC